jgi:gamma-glutamyl-gamma-aminobutyrate hydrolase PuuD
MPGPLVAIPTYHLAWGRITDWSRGGYALPEPYVDAVRRAGGRPVLVPAPDPGGVGAVLDMCDALLLAGGGDVEPSRAGGSAHPAVYGVDAERDELELGLVAAAARAGVPTLAICRGFQVANVAFGGTLLPHLPDVDGLRPHGTPVGGKSVYHDVKVAAGSALEAVGGAEIRDCVSHHHQGVDRVGDGLVAVAWSDDGLVEGLERDGGEGFFVAVQWHPEMSAHTDPVQQRLFDALVAAA